MSSAKRFRTFFRSSPSFRRRRQQRLATERLEDRHLLTTFNPVTVADLTTAIDTANSNNQADTIDLGGGTFTLTVVNNVTDGNNGLPSVLADSGNALTIQNGTIERDSGTESDFRIFHVATGGDLTVDNAMITGGESGSESGGGFFNYGTLNVSNSTISGNTANSGGGLSNFGTLTVGDSTVSDNDGGVGGAGNGGGIYNGSVLSVIDSTVSGNTAETGGGIANYGTTSVTNSTVSGNTSYYGGGGIANHGTLNSNNSIVATNSDASGPDILGSISGDHNLIGDGTDGTVTGSNNQVGTSGSPIDPLLGPLQNNGGPTETHALFAGSPAVDAGDNGLANDHGPDATIGGGDDTPLSTDQRGTGFDRIVGGTVDVGAFELGAGGCGLTVTTTADAGAGSLREAIVCSNVTAGLDTIDFAISGVGPHTILPLSALPTVTDAAIIDGYTQADATPNTNPPTSGSNAVLQVVVDGSSAGAGANGLTINSGGTTVRGLVINEFSGSGIEITTTGGNKLQGNFIGTDVTGALAAGNTLNGIRISGASSNIIGTNGDGVNDSAEGNLISGNLLRGVRISGTGTDNNVVAGNLIGTDVTGTVDLGNLNDGVGITLGAQNNIIGTNGDGTSDAIERNVISGNGGVGALITNSGTNQNTVAGNYIGVDVTGALGLGNVEQGVRIDDQSKSNVVGTDGDGSAGDGDEGNVISGNSLHGLAIFNSGTDSNVVAGNNIGTNAAGTAQVANVLDGVRVTGGGQFNRIGTDGNGTSDTEERNVISGNFVSGVVLGGSQNVAAGNYIGTAANGSTPLANGGQGVQVVSSTGNVIGGAGVGNLIAFNALNGVRVDPGTTGTRIQENSIHTNVGLGIDLGNDGVTLNDPDDPDAGANNLQNFPVITSAVSTGGNTTISGTLNSVASSNFTLEFFANTSADGSGFGEGETFVGSTTVTTDASGDASFSATFAVSIPLGQFVVGTATDAASNTSEFPRNIVVTADEVEFTAATYSDGEAGTSTVVTLVRTDDSAVSEVQVSITGGTALGGTVDYDDTTFPLTVTFNVGELTKTVPIPISQESLVELDETITFDVIAISGATIGTQNTTTLTIENDDFITGRVFDDLDNDGVFETGDGDAGIANVTMQLVDQTSTLVVDTQTTAMDGTYTFSVTVPAGTYTIVEVVDELIDLGLLDGQETAGVNGGMVDNSQDSNEITDIPIGFANLPQGAVDYLFAEVRPSDIFGSVWRDFNNDGEINFGEAGINNVTITLTGTDDRGNAVNLTDVTAVDGSYAFIDLRPGVYMLEETQPAGFDDGSESLGEVSDLGVPTAVADLGFIDGNDKFSGITLVPGSEGDLYNFGERPLAGDEIGDGVTATIGFWHNKNGVNLIEALNGGATSTQLGTWLAATFPDMYGAGAFYDAAKGADQDMDLTGKTNAEVAEIFKYLHKRNKKTSVAGGPPKVDAQVMAVALATYATSETLAGGNIAASFGFNTSADGIAYTTFNVLDVLSPSEAADLGLTPNVDGMVSIIDILLATNDKAADGLLYDADNDDTIDALELTLRTLANDLYTAINEGSDI